MKTTTDKSERIFVLKDYTYHGEYTVLRRYGHGSESVLKTFRKRANAETFRTIFKALRKAKPNVSEMEIRDISLITLQSKFL